MKKVILSDVVVGSAPTRRAGDPGSNPGPGENFSFKINNKTLCLF